MKSREKLDRLHVRIQLEDLGADVGVDSDEVEVPRALDAAHGLLGEPVVEAEAELRVELAGLRRSCGWRA